jgi:hypothetical protein
MISNFSRVFGLGCGKQKRAVPGRSKKDLQGQLPVPKDDAIAASTSDDPFENSSENARYRRKHQIGSLLLRRIR